MLSEECATAVPVYFVDVDQLRWTSSVVIETLLSAVMVPTDSELEAVSCVCVDVFERFLHGQSEQNQLAEVMPAILTVLNASEKPQEMGEKKFSSFIQMLVFTRF